MTQGEVLSAFAPIETFDQICVERQGRIGDYMSPNDVNMMMPFVTKAQEAAEKISRFALDNVNSKDKNIRELVKMIHDRLSLYSWSYNEFKGRDSSVDWLNNNIKSVTNQIINTYEYLSALLDEPENTDSRFEELEAENKRLSEKNKELEEENEQLKKQPTIDSTDEESVENKWISCFDTFLDDRLNAEAIAEKLHEIASPHLQKNKRSFWWVVFTVFSEIHWIPNTSANQKTLLQWANLHFDCGWDWRKNNQFKFSDIQAKIKTKKSSEWNKNLTGNVIGDYYGELAQNIKDAFVEIIDGRIIDRACFILPGCQRINTGR